MPSSAWEGTPPWAYWSGAVFLSSAILSTFYLLSWPGLLEEKGLIARLSNTASWFFFMTFFSLALLAIVAAARLDRRSKPMARAYLLYATSAFLAIIVGVLSLAFEDSLPQLVAGLTFSPLNLAWVFTLWAIMGIGAVTAYRRYRKEQDVFLGYLAPFLTLMAFRILYSALGGKRYDIWWYGSRVVYDLGFITMLFGLIQEGYALFSRERVLANLITNALKYSAADMPVEVRVEELDSQVGRRSTFRLMLPREQAQEAPPEDGSG